MVVDDLVWRKIGKVNELMVGAGCADKKTTSKNKVKIKDDIGMFANIKIDQGFRNVECIG